MANIYLNLSLKGCVMTDNNLFQEAKEELEKQKLIDFWKKNGTFIIVCASVVVLSTAAGVMYRSVKEEAQQQNTDALYAVSKSGASVNEQIDNLEAFAEDAAENKSLALIAEENSYSEVAVIKAGLLAVEDKQFQKALDIFEKFLASKSSDQYLNDMAVLLLVQTQLDIEYEKSNPEKGFAIEPEAAKTFISRLEPLTKEGAALRFSVLETMGYIKLYAGDKDGAVKVFETIVKDPQAPASISDRAGSILRSFNSAE